MKDWFAWLIIGVLLGVALAAVLVAAVGSESHERGGTLDLTSRDARGALRLRAEASEYAQSMERIQNADWYDRDRVIAEERERIGFPIDKFTP